MFLKSVKKLFKAYIKNIFDGKITTLIGLALVVLGIMLGFRGADYSTIIELVILGLVIMGFKDPRLGGGPTQNETPKEP